jgi:hypothetical protein
MTHVPYPTKKKPRAQLLQPPPPMITPTQLSIYTNTNVHSSTPHLPSAITVNTVNTINNINPAHSDIPPAHIQSVENINSTYITHTTHPQPHSNHHLTHPSVINVNTTDTPHTLTPADIHDLLTPHLLHQHSLLSAVHALLLPLPPTSPISLPTLNTLHRILSDSPRHIAMLPPLPRIRPLRAPPAVLR